MYINFLLATFLIIKIKNDFRKTRLTKEHEIDEEVPKPVIKHVKEVSSVTQVYMYRSYGLIVLVSVLLSI